MAIRECSTHCQYPLVAKASRYCQEDPYPLSCLRRKADDPPFLDSRVKSPLAMSTQPVDLTLWTWQGGVASIWSLACPEARGGVQSANCVVTQPTLQTPAPG